MPVFGRDEPSTGLFADDVLLAVNQSANGQPAFVSFGNGRHMGKFPQSARESIFIHETGKIPRTFSGVRRNCLGGINPPKTNSPNPWHEAASFTQRI
jgi:hypothetical protein